MLNSSPNLRLNLIKNVYLPFFGKSEKFDFYEIFHLIFVKKLLKNKRFKSFKSVIGQFHYN